MIAKVEVSVAAASIEHTDDTGSVVSQAQRLAGWGVGRHRPADPSARG
jgi:hypothetical protein